MSLKPIQFKFTKKYFERDEEIVFLFWRPKEINKIKKKKCTAQKCSKPQQQLFACWSGHLLWSHQGSGQHSNWC